MRSLLLRFLINVVAIGVITSGLLRGIYIAGNAVPTLALVALIFGLVNALIKPIVRVLTCPFVLLTLGLFTFVINGAMLYLTAALSQFTLNISNGELRIHNFWWAILGGLIVSVVDMLLEWALIRSEPAHEIVVRYQAPPPNLPPDDAGDDDFDFYDPNTGQIKSKK